MKFFLVFILFLSFGACSREEVRVYRTAKENGSSAAESGRAAVLSLHWDEPAGWKEKPASGMRAASFEGPGSVDISVVSLPGDAGGELANINRWRGQVGLESWDDREFALRKKQVHTGAGPLIFFSFTGKPQGSQESMGLLAGLMNHQGVSWFFKAMGPEAAVKRLKPDFLKFLQSIHEAH